jgi:hypothetical protein
MQLDRHFGLPHKDFIGYQAFGADAQRWVTLVHNLFSKRVAMSAGPVCRYGVGYPRG